MLLAALSLALALAAAPVQVISDDCPSAREVEQALSRLLPDVPAHVPRDTARIARRGATVRVEIVDREGHAVAHRMLPAEATCAELASLIATVIASLESDVHPTFGEPQLAVERPGIAASATMPARVGRAASFDVGLGGGLGYTDSSAALAVLSGTLVPHERGPGLRAHAMMQSSRSMVIDGGRGHWQRWVVGAAGAWRWGNTALLLDVHAGALLGWLAADGDGYARNESVLSLSPGASVGTRLSSWSRWGVALALDVGAFYFAQKQTLRTSQGDDRRTVPRWEALATLSVLVGRPPRGVDETRPTEELATTHSDPATR